MLKRDISRNFAHVSFYAGASPHTSQGDGTHHMKYLKSKFWWAGVGVLFSFFLPSFASAIELDNGKCVDFYLIYKDRCEMAIEKIAVPDDFGNCNATLDSFRQELSPVMDSLLAKYYGNAEKPEETDCWSAQNYFFIYTNQIFDPASSPDSQKCQVELLKCANLFQSCSGHTGKIKLNDLEGQCTDFLKGGSVAWDSLAGKDLCADATKLQGTIEQKCAKYEEGKVKAEEEAGYRIPNRSYQFDEEAEAIRLAQKNKIEGLAQGTFHQIGDRSPQKIIGDAIKVFMGILGSIALAMFVYGGFMVMAGGGNAEKTGKGTQILIWSALGVVVILASYTLVQFVFDIM